MGISRTLHTNLRTILNAIASLQVVYNRPSMEFTGFPAAFMVPVSNDNQFQSTNENERMYSFRVWAFVEYDTVSADTAYNTLMDVIDDIVNAIDKEEDPQQNTRIMGTALPSGYTLMAVMPALGQIIPDEEVKLLAAEITVRCKVLVDLTLLS